MKYLKNQITYVVDFFEIGKWAQFCKSGMYRLYQKGGVSPLENRKTPFLAGMSNSTVYTAVYTVQYTVTVQCFLEI